MASLGVIETLLNGLPTDSKKVLLEVFRALVPRLRFGPIDPDTPKAENFDGFTLSSTTGTSTSEFSIEHGMGRTPYRISPCADLTAVNSAIVPLQVTRAADAKRIYLKSSVTSTPFSIYVE